LKLHAKNLTPCDIENGADLKRRQRGALEAEVLATLWAADRPLTAGEVAVELDGTLAYTTVQTILARLLAKGAVQRQQAGRAHAYSAVLDGSGIAATKMLAQLDTSDDRTSILSRFLQDLSPEDEAALSTLLNQRKGQADS
jgi:predicted transcriptional regulator